MHFHHLHFYVRDVAFWRDWFIHKLAFQPDFGSSTNAQQPLVIKQGAIEIWLSDAVDVPKPAVSHYLHSHPPGVADIGFATDQFDRLLNRLHRYGVKPISGVTHTANGQRQCQVQGWADLRHTLVEVSSQWATARQMIEPPAYEEPHLRQKTAQTSWLDTIDHVVINVPQGELATASAWYQQVFGLEIGQRFDIHTARSGLRSQVLIHPEGTLQLPINEPTSANSQIQEFLAHNRGAGVQHVALHSQDAVSAIAHFRQQGLTLIHVPSTYYEGLQLRPDCPLADTSAASRQQLLIDWAEGGQQGSLLQTFTQPIFTEPTFFFEIIERSTYPEQGQLKRAKGFGEGNFQALFEAIERAQVERGSLS
ncbi:MAG: 4-hydroxyphenylpyruvate dioxygenase [Phormidesmis sp. RL_2_1]|nr:4-hydroxyphenylpyruvate dioxygenase [Phormidesmis sp. RL_2_1]